MNFKLSSSVFCLTLASLVVLTICDSGSASSDSTNTRESPATIAFNPPDNAQRVERSPKYDFGLGKRRYIITTGGPGKKRLPHYNFGLGKRANPYSYSFGLGKRASDDAEVNYEEEVDQLNNFYNSDNGLNLEQFENAANLDKNDIDIDYDLMGFRNGLDKRAPRQYSFGLGKRRAYDFGLGKRKYSDNDALDKRLPNRYNFGLGR